MALTNTKGKRVAIIGASGYGGIQLMRLLKYHPDFEVTYLGGERTIGQKWNQICHFLTVDNSVVIEKPDLKDLALTMKLKEEELREQAQNLE